ncbi:hypothetical protein C8R45DRAFT_1414 [Mycena sanguinolenta]|nr:hypothetical protein C8R45DRAFT_1414 [Mycena sanguinolenta]
MSMNTRREGLPGHGSTALEPVGGTEKETKIRFAYTQFERIGIIAETNVPESRRSKLYFSVTSPAIGSIIIALHFEGRETPVQELQVDDLLQMQRENKDLDFESFQLNIAKLVDVLQPVFPLSAAHRSATNRAVTLPKILIHESLLTLLRAACTDAPGLLRSRRP